MDPTISHVINLLSVYGYFVLFILVILEGPVVTIFAGLLASLGIFNFLLAYLTIMTADLTGDAIYYSVGRWWLKSLNNRVFSFFKITRKKFKNIESVFKKHEGKFLFFGKFSSFFGSLVMFIAGVVKVPFGEFMGLNFGGTIIKSLLLMLVGFYFGGVINKLGKNLDMVASLSLLVLAILFIGVYMLISKLTDRFVSKAEK